MKLICALILWQVLLQVSKEDTVPAKYHLIDMQKEEMEDKNNQKILEEEVTMHKNELSSKNKEIEILNEEMTKLQRELQNHEEKESNLVRELNQTKLLGANMTRLKRELESKNDQIKDLQDNVTALRRELESKYDAVGKCSMPTVQGELSRQHRIMDKLEKNLSEKQKDEINQLYRNFYSKSERLERCENELTIQKNTSVTKDQTIDRLEKELIILKNTSVTRNKKIDELESKVQRLVDKIKERHEKRCTDRNSTAVHYIALCQAFEVLCNSDIAGPGWTIIQQRINGKVNFYRNWTMYREGFGDFWDGDFFLGLEKIHRLTADQPHELYIHMERFDGSTFYARYDEFAIAGGDDQYKLIKLGAFSGSAEYSQLGPHQNMNFTTYDRDNDLYDDDNCAKSLYGGWWYRSCAYTNLNGRYYSSKVRSMRSLYWEDFTSLKQVKMMIRPKEV